jgi:hypothetical protein
VAAGAVGRLRVRLRACEPRTGVASRMRLRTGAEGACGPKDCRHAGWQQVRLEALAAGVVWVCTLI